MLLKHCYEEYCWDLSISLAEALTVTGVITTLILGLYQYHSANKWKKKEFLLTYIQNYREILKDPMIKRGLLMLDWNRIDIQLQTGEIENQNKIVFTDELFRSALRIHFEMDKTNDGFSPEEVIIRLAIDEVLGRLGELAHLVNIGRIQKDEIPEDIKYWIEIIGNKKNPNKDEKTRSALWKYIVSYKYSGIISLCKKFGYKIT